MNMTKQELNLIIKNHGKWLCDQKGGERANLSGANLSGANLRYADLRYADLSGANLSGANLRYADLRYADLSGANLRYADLSGANLRYADLSGANLWSTVGNQNQIKTIQTDIWQIVYTDTVMQIGCQRHDIADWFNFNDEKIGGMDNLALEWWGKWKPILALVLGREV